MKELYYFKFIILQNILSSFKPVNVCDLVTLRHSLIPSQLNSHILRAHKRICLKTNLEMNWGIVSFPDRWTRILSMRLVFMMPALVTVVEIASASALQLLRTPRSASRLRPVFSGELLISAVSNR